LQRVRKDWVTCKVDIIVCSLSGDSGGGRKCKGRIRRKGEERKREKNKREEKIGKKKESGARKG
jgi:hypothetical protein